MQITPAVVISVTECNLPQCSPLFWDVQCLYREKVCCLTQFSTEQNQTLMVLFVFQAHRSIYRSSLSLPLSPPEGASPADHVPLLQELEMCNLHKDVLVVVVCFVFVSSTSSCLFLELCYCLQHKGLFFVILCEPGKAPCEIMCNRTGFTSWLHRY